MNLIGNAVKFTAQGEVVIKADVHGIDSDRALVQISVADTGIGMDAATIAKIFEPFTQADESTTPLWRQRPGLAICRELAELLGGTITVESRPRGGSTFSLSLPLKLTARLRQPQQYPRRCRRASVHVLTRRPALDRITGPARRALGLSVQAEDSGGDLVIVDAGSYQQYLHSYLDCATGRVRRW
jgi:two-component system sensor histidine kinase/response regulator